MTRATSRNAYRQHHADGGAASKTEIIRAYIEAHPECSARDVEDGTGFRTCEVTGRIAELKKNGMIRECGHKRQGKNTVLTLCVRGYVLPLVYDQDLPLEA
jgi:predicted transcriptional regulator